MGSDSATKVDKAYSAHLSSLGHDRLTSVKIAGYDAWYGGCLPEDRNAAIFDFGCGYGDFLEYLRLKGYTNISGGDISPECVRKASERLGVLLEIIDDVKSFSESHKGRYDCVNLKDVVEHIDKPHLVEFLARIKTTLKPEGFVIVSCPQMCGFTSLYTLYDDFTHKTLFTENSLRYVLAAAGFSRIEMIRPAVPFKFNPVSLLHRAARKAWFLFISVVYSLERPGERMPSTPGDRIACKGWA